MSMRLFLTRKRELYPVVDSRCLSVAHQQSQGCQIPKYASRRALSGGIRQPWLGVTSEERGGFEVFRTSNTRFGPGCEQERCMGANTECSRSGTVANSAAFVHIVCTR